MFGGVLVDCNGLILIDIVSIIQDEAFHRE